MGKTEFEIFGGMLSNLKTNDLTVRFILLNSSWSSFGDNDYKKLLISRWQLESLKMSNDNLESADLTLALVHHPINWLYQNEEEYIKDFLTNSNCLPVDAVLHGHIHSGSINIEANPDRRLLSLVSGIGYSDKNNRQTGFPKDNVYRYAIYCFNIDTGNVDIWLRISNGNNFAADTLLYKKASEDGKISLEYKKKDQQIKDFKTVELDPIPLISEWVGRKVELSNLFEPKIKLAAITGVGGQGKTALASEFLRRNTRGNNAVFELGVWVDCRELPDSLHTKLLQLLSTLSDNKETIELYREEKYDDTLKRFLRYLKERKVLIVFDNIDAYVKPQSEGVTTEFKKIFDLILDNQHNSLIIVTCRPFLNDFRGSFRHILLKGLDPNEGVEFFNKRGIVLVDDNNEQYCKTLILLTKGHPLWLGLIAGQVLSEHDSLKNCVEKLNRGEETVAIRDYFNSVWIQLSKHPQQLLRYLVEAPRPLIEEEICRIVENFSPKKTKQQIRRLERKGLLERHEGSVIGSVVYQVHPLIRQYVYETYSPDVQRKFVTRVLYLFLAKEMVNILFANTLALDKLSISEMVPKNLIDSIETCLNSRNEKQALELLERYRVFILTKGFYHQFYSLTCRALELINWEESKICQRNRGVDLLSNLIDLLVHFGEKERAFRYLQHYRSLIESNTISYLKYLGIASSTYWTSGDFNKALLYVDEYKSLVQKFEVDSNIEHTQALVLRDLGRVNEALKIFLDLNPIGVENDAKSPAVLGNIARCYQKLNNFELAEKYLGAPEKRKNPYQE